MKVLSILGSPRKKGNSATLAGQVTSKLEQSGALVATHVLNQLDYKGCQSCYVCKGKMEKCAVKDDLTPILDAMHDADVIVMASPNYYGYVTGQMKTFLDRTFSLLTPEFATGPNRSRLATGKHLVFVFTQGADETMFTDVLSKFEQLKFYYGFQAVHLLHGCELMDTKDASGRTDLLQQADGIAEKVGNALNPDS